MKAFMEEDFLLTTARRLFHEYAKAIPIVDYHCHVSPQEIYESRRFDKMVTIINGVLCVPMALKRNT